MIQIIDMGWGDLRLADSPDTRVTPEQAERLAEFGPTAEAGASEVRYGRSDITGEVTVFENGTIVEVAENGTTETFN